MRVWRVQKVEGIATQLYRRQSRFQSLRRSFTSDHPALIFRLMARVDQPFFIHGSDIRGLHSGIWAVVCQNLR